MSTFTTRVSGVSHNQEAVSQCWEGAPGGLGGPVKAIREASPQARHHFTQADQVNQLLVGVRFAGPDTGSLDRRG